MDNLHDQTQYPCGRVNWWIGEIAMGVRISTCFSANHVLKCSPFPQVRKSDFVEKV